MIDTLLKLRSMKTGKRTFGNQSTSSNMRRNKRKSEEIAVNFNTTPNITQSIPYSLTAH